MKNPLSALTHATRAAAQEILVREKRGVLTYLPFIGPAIIASVAYMDPGNFATNIQAGAKFGYQLLWVVLVANLIAMLFQSLSAKLGIVTGKSLAELCREHFAPPLVYFMWVASEIAAIATDLAEVLGGAIGLTLLFHLPLLVSTGIVGIVTYVVLLLQGSGFRPMEIIIGGFIGVISMSYVAELFIASPEWGAVAHHLIVPQLGGSESLMLAVGILGATVMPHAIYLHSSLMKDRVPTRHDADKRRVLHYSNYEVMFALAAAGLVNMAMLTVSAVVFFASGHQQVADIETAYRTLGPLLGEKAAGIFMLSLLASGLSSSVVGTMAGQTIMQDFVHIQIPVVWRRLFTLVPALVVVALGFNSTQVLIVSQVILSLVLPLPVAALIWLTSRREIMGNFVNSPLMSVLGVFAGAVVLSLNALLLVSLLGF